MFRRFATVLPLLLAAACSATPGTESTGATEGESAFSSDQATLLDFEFDAELLTDRSFGTDKTIIQDQLLYTMGHLNTDRSVGRLDKVTLTNVVRSKEGEKTLLKYHAKLPVAWASKTTLPTSYDFVIPRDLSSEAVEAFTEKYKHDCVDFGAHDVDSGSMWYYYRPRNSACKLEDAAVVRTRATITKSTENTTGKFPEYHKVWEDDALNVVAIFGKYEDGGDVGDAGVSAYNSFVASMKRELAGATTTPETVPASPGTKLPDVSFTKKLPDGKTVNVTALLVDNIGSTTRAFDERYNALSSRADLIAYNGHAGLGQNVRALARKGKFVAGQYQIIFMNGCDTFAYVDGSLAETRAKINADDPTGTKYMEFITNAMPSFFSSMSNATTSVVKGLLGYASPKTYDQIFTGIDRSEVVLVTGEEDNVFTPGMKIGSGGTVDPVTPFSFKLEGSPARNEEVRGVAKQLAAGSYTFTMTGTGDADLHVKVGSKRRRRATTAVRTTAGRRSLHREGRRHAGRQRSRARLRGDLHVRGRRLQELRHSLGVPDAGTAFGSSPRSSFQGSSPTMAPSASSQNSGRAGIARGTGERQGEHGGQDVARSTTRDVPRRGRRPHEIAERARGRGRAQGPRLDEDGAGTEAFPEIVGGRAEGGEVGRRTTDDVHFPEDHVVLRTS
ncbi:MAG: hypothetical protein U0169_06560 [Polyangiaceae bacterium]